MTTATVERVQRASELLGLSIGQLRERWLELFGEASTSRNKVYLAKRIAYREQERRYGGLSPRAQAQATQLAKDAPIRRRFAAGTVPVEAVMPPPRRLSRDPRLPAPGTELRRTFRGVEHVVTVLEDGFLYEGSRYRSLSVVARKVTGTRWNGFAFFDLLAKKDAA